MLHVNEMILNAKLVVTGFAQINPWIPRIKIENREILGKDTKLVLKNE